MTSAERKLAREMRAAGATFKELSAAIPTTTTYQLRCVVDSSYADRERSRPRYSKAARPEAADKAELRRRLRAIPQDTRDLTGRLNGDPLPGRSALDMRGPG